MTSEDLIELPPCQIKEKKKILLPDETPKNKMLFKPLCHLCTFKCREVLARRQVSIDREISDG